MGAAFVGRQFKAHQQDVLLGWRMRVHDELDSSSFKEGVVVAVKAMAGRGKSVELLVVKVDRSVVRSQECSISSNEMTFVNTDIKMIHVRMSQPRK